MTIETIEARAPFWLLVAGMTLASTACGNLTAGGIGEARVIVSGDAPESSSQAAAMSTEPTPAATPARSSHEDSPEGQLKAKFRLYVVSQDGALLALTDDEVEVEVDLEGVETPEVADRRLPADVYTGLRMVFTEIQAEVDAGLIINGDTITGEIKVELEDLTLSVTKPLTVAIADEAVVEVLIDLNAASWLQAVDPEAGTVQAQVFADLITVTVR